MFEHYYEFIPLGDPPTVQNIQDFLYKGLLGLVIIAIACFLICEPNKYLEIFLLYLVVSLLLLCIVLTNRYTIKIVIDKSVNKLYRYYLTIQGEQGVTEIDLTRATNDYKLQVTRASVQWELTIKDSTNKIKLRQSRSSSRVIKNVYSKEQLDEIYKLVS